MFRPKRKTSDFSEEIEAHVLMEIDRLREQGLSEDAAQAAAYRTFGSPRRARETFYESHRWMWWDHLVQDIRFGLRTLRKSPGFTAVAVLTLALGIGANTAIFSLIDALLLRSLPVRNPQELMLFQWSARKAPTFPSRHSSGDCVERIADLSDSTSCSFSHPFFDKLRTEVKMFSSIAASGGNIGLDVTGNGPGSLIQGLIVSGNYFETLGVRPVVGRVLDSSDDQPGAPAVAVLSYGCWQRVFGGSLSTLGRTIELNGVPTTIAGVAERRFSGLTPGSAPDAWIPMSLRARLFASWSPQMDDAGTIWLVIVGRLKPEVSREQAQAAVSLLFHNEMVYGPYKFSKESDDPRISLLPVQAGLVGIRGDFSTPLFVLMIAVGIVLLIASANVAGLLLARSTTRQKEMAVRVALGAGRGRIVRQLLTESLLLSLAGAASGILFAIWGAHAIADFVTASSDRPMDFSATIDGRVLLFTAAVAVLTGIFFGLAPAMRGTRVDLTPTLKDAPATTSRIGNHWFGVRNVLVVGQIGLTMIVLVGAGLVVRTLQNLRGVDPGFDTTDVLNFRIAPTLSGYKDPQVNALYQRLQSRLSMIPGVMSVSYSSVSFLAGWASATSFRLPGAKDYVRTQFISVGVNFFATMGIPVLQGRDFSAEDFPATTAPVNASAQKSSSSSGAAPVAPSPTRLRPAIVNQSFVHEYLRSADPLGWRFGGSGDSTNPGFVIVGVVRDAMYTNLKQKVLPTMYVPDRNGSVTFELRTATNPSSIVPAVRAGVGEVDKNLPLSDVKTESQAIDQLLFQERLIARLSSFFGALALVVACVGLYGLLSYEVTRRTREIGIRMALGAGRSEVLGVVVRKGLALAIAGVILGSAAAFGLTRFLGSILFEVRPGDPVTQVAVAAILLIVSFAACVIPARGAVRVDPMVALRYE
jgi:predicted permease